MEVVRLPFKARWFYLTGDFDLKQVDGGEVAVPPGWLLVAVRRKSSVRVFVARGGRLEEIPVDRQTAEAILRTVSGMKSGA